MTKYAYKIIKRQPHESLGGYGYTLSLYKNNKRVFTNGAYATKQMALIGLEKYLQNQIEEYGVLKVFDIKEMGRK